MADTVFAWVMLALVTAPIWLPPLLGLWRGFVQPMSISEQKIEEVAQQYVRKHGGDAEKMAFIEEDAAWRRGHEFEQGRWRRIRARIRQLVE